MIKTTDVYEKLRLRYVLSSIVFCILYFIVFAFDGGIFLLVPLGLLIYCIMIIKKMDERQYLINKKIRQYDKKQIKRHRKIVDILK